MDSAILQDLTKNDTVIVDEAHNIIAQLMTPRPEWNALQFTRAIDKAGRVVFMTGTPITSSYRGIMDLALLINIGSGHNVLPMDNLSFMKRFFRVKDTFRAKLLTKIYPTISTNPIGKSGLKMALAYSSKVLESFTYAIMVTSAVRALSQMRGPKLIEHVFSEAETKYRGWLGRASALIDRFLPIGNMVSSFLNRLLRIQIGMKLDSEKTKLPGFASVDRQFGNILVDVAFVKTLSLLQRPVQRLADDVMHTKWYDREERDMLMQVDMELLGPAVRDIVLAFKITDQDPNFPRVNVVRRACAYNEGQMLNMLKLCDGVMDDDLIHHFVGSRDNLLENIKFMGTLPLDEFLDEATSIGSMTTRGEFAPKLMALSRTITPMSVVWSRFERDVLEVGRMLGVHKPQFRVERVWNTDQPSEIDATLDKFTRGDADVLLLHPAMYQGISIRGARQMHILEPSADTLKIDQAMVRVRRFQSHAHLPMEEREVTVFMWYCRYDSKDKEQHAAYNKAAATFVRQFKPHLHESLTDLNYETGWVLDRGGPDEMTMRSGLQVDDLVERITTYLAKEGTTCSKMPLRCCVWQPNEADMGACMQTTGLAACSAAAKGGGKKKTKSDHVLHFPHRVHAKKKWGE